MRLTSALSVDEISYTSFQNFFTQSSLQRFSDLVSSFMTVYFKSTYKKISKIGFDLIKLQNHVSYQDVNYDDRRQNECIGASIKTNHKYRASYKNNLVNKKIFSRSILVILYSTTVSIIYVRKDKSNCILCKVFNHFITKRCIIDKVLKNNF